MSSPEAIASSPESDPAGMLVGAGVGGEVGAVEGPAVGVAVGAGSGAPVVPTTVTGPPELELPPPQAATDNAAIRGR